jgi:murein L,D-transpeptidase YcbB/YkuD
MYSLKFPLTIVLFFLIFANSVFSQNSSSEQIIENRVEAGFDNNPVFAQNIVLFSQVEISKFYSNRNFHLAWGDKKNREDLISSLEASYEEGLLPEDYHLDRINSLIGKSSYKNLSEVDLVDLDLLMTDAMILYASHLISGKVDQSKLRTEWDLNINEGPKNPDSLLTVILSQHQIKQTLESFKPKSSFYDALKLRLKEYRELAKKGGWNKIPDGETLKKGMTDKRIVDVRKYLSITKDLPANADLDNPLFDEELELAVKKFQFRHNLTEDGAIGKGTLAQMNMSVEDRVDMMRLNLERTRWVLHHPESDFLIVNIAGFNIKRIQNRKVVYKSRVIVGKNHKESPIFKNTVEYIVFNPTWTLPYSIATHETLPRLKKDPGYLAAKNMEIMDRNGKILDPSSIDFNKYSTGNFPFIIRQKAGPHNALGQVKFIFPNKYSVYLHDTPVRSLFNREDRAFSHGCIRLEDKWELAMGLLDEPDVWNMDKINKILASGKTTRVNLKTPIDIYILYWTAGVDRDNNLYFERDVYNRDPAILKALDAPIVFKKIN